jgi:hypothetical protein
MALVKCKECGQSISSKAPSCPFCGVPIKKSSSLGCLLLAVIIGAVIFVFLARLGERAQSSLNPPSVSVRCGDSVIEITNTATANWSHMTVYINGHPPFAYKWDGPAPAVGQSKMISLNDFDKDGERFDPVKYKVTEAWVGGNGYDFSSFNVTAGQ